MKTRDALISLSKKISELQAKEAEAHKGNIGNQSILATIESGGRREAYLKVQSIIMKDLLSLPFGS